MKVKTSALLIVCTVFFSPFAKAQPVKTNEITVRTPFNDVTITTPDFSTCRQFSITDFGAVKGDKEKTSHAIAAAIDKANKTGGGIVVIPEGEWLTKTIHFKSNVNLHLNKGAVLLFSESPEDYLPAVPSSWEGMECYNYSPLIYAYRCKNISLTGRAGSKQRWTCGKAGLPAPLRTWRALNVCTTGHGTTNPFRKGRW